MNQVMIEQAQSADDPLPPSWTRDCIGDYVAEFVGGCSPTKRDYAATGFLVLNKGNIKPYGAIAFKEERKYVPKNYADQFADRFITHSDLVVTLRDLSQKADFLGLIGIYRENEAALLTQGAYLIRLKPGIEDRYLVYYSNSPAYRSLAKKGKHGSTQVHLRNGDFLCFSIPIAPPEEQRRIVAEIEKQFTRLEAGVAALRRVQANLKRYRAAVLKAACEGKLVPTEHELAKAEGKSKKDESKRGKPSSPTSSFLIPPSSLSESGEALLQRILAERRQNWQGRGKYKEPAAPDTANLPPLPEGWTWATAEQLTDENRSITYGVIKLGAPVPDGVHVLRSSDVRHLRLDLEDVKRVSSDIAGEYRRTFLKGGEVLITVRGTLGGVVVAPAECAGFNISREVAMLAMVELPVAKIAAIFIGSAPLQRWLLQRAKGIAYTGINIETLKELPIPLPPLAEQTRIVAEVERRLSVVEELESVVSANLQRATRLRQSILQKAFTGELTS